MSQSDYCSNYSDSMTILTREKYDLVLSQLTLSDAEHELRENACVRSVREILSKATMVDIHDKAALSRFLNEKIQVLNTSLSKESIGKNIRNWLADGTTSISKPSGYLLAFALALPLPEAEKLLMQLCSERIHWRDPEEIVFCFALNTGRSYREAQQLYADLQGKGIFNYLDEDPDCFTENLEYDLIRITDPADLETYLVDHKKMLGKFHNTARSTVVELLNYLKRPSDSVYLDLKGADDLSVQEIIKEHLYGEIIPRTSRAAKGTSGEKLILNALQKCIWNCWPEETKLNKMEHGKLDVSRKILVLLFMATDGADSVYGDWADTPREDIFEDRLARLNTMLVDCGYSLLDPRAPFDWMVLYCLCDNDSFIADDKMKKFLEHIFSGETE